MTAYNAYTTAVNRNDIKTLLANGLSKFFIKGKPVFSYGPRSFPLSPPDCTILEIWVFDSFIIVEKSLQKPYKDLLIVY